MGSYPELTDNAKFVLEKRLLLKNVGGEVVEDFDGMCHRVAKAVGGDKYENQFFDLLRSLDFLPNSPCLTNAGKPNMSYAACFVLPAEDSIESIFETVKNAALIHKAGGGVGLSGINIRPRGSIVAATGGIASGPVSLLFQVVNDATEQIKQGCFVGETRILTKDGLIPISEIVNNRTVGYEVWTHKGWRRIVGRFVHGEKEFIEIELSTGARQRITREHKVAILDRLEVRTIPAGQLKEGDRVIHLLGPSSIDREPVKLEHHGYVPTKMTTTTTYDIVFPEYLDIDTSYLIGYYLGNGHDTPDGNSVTISIPKSRPEIVDKLVHIIKKFNLRPRVNDGCGECVVIRVHSVIFVHWLRSNGFIKKHSYEIRVPDKMFRVSNGIASSFVSGYFDADGSDKAKKNGYVFSSVSRGMLSDIQKLLLGHGIASQIYCEERSKTTEWRDLYSLSIAGREFRLRFFDMVHRYSLKAKDPGNIKKDFRFSYSHDTVHALKCPSKYSYGLYASNNPHGMTYSAMCRMQEVLRKNGHPLGEELDELVRMLPVEVKRITDAGKAEAFDIEVDGVHLLSGDGLYASNSTRRGANIGVMPIWHPDALHFIRYKIKDGQLKNFNISVAITDQFMNELQSAPNEPHVCRFKNKRYWLLPDATWKLMSDDAVPPGNAVTRRQLWEEIVSNAHSNGDPGLFFIDTVNKSNACLLDAYNEDDPEYICGPNPCGEQPLRSFDTCTLGSINLSNLTDCNGIDLERLKVRVEQAIRFLNCVLDVNYYPIPEIREVTSTHRKIGLGVMGWADTLIKLGHSYNEEESWKFGEELAAFIEKTAWVESFRIASERGPYSAFGDGKAWLRVHGERWGRLVDEFGHGPANMAITSIAPTGTISMVAGCSSGIEPIFSWAFVQRRVGTESAQIHPLIADVIGMERCIDLRVKAAEQYPKDTVRQVGWINSQLIPVMKQHGHQFVTSHEVSGQAHLEHQAAFQRHITDGCSKTVNLPNEATKEHVEQAYIWAWRNNLKGITVYREGSRSGEVLSTGLKALQEDHEGKPKDKRPNVVPAIIVRDRVETSPGEYENVYISVGLLGATIKGGKPYEVFLEGAKADSRIAQGIDSVTRLSSTALRHGTPPNVVVQQLGRIRGQQIFSLPRKVGQAIQLALEMTDDVPEELKQILDKCSVVVDGNLCGGQLVFREGCYQCLKCLSSKCG